MRGKVLVVLALAALLTPLAALPAQSEGGLCFGLFPTMFAVAGVDTIGSAGNDIILGTAGPDTIYGNGGRDTICGEGGDDILWGGPGRDRIDGGEGNDLIDPGGGQNQMLKGGAGSDTIRSRGEGSRAYGGAGNDSVTAKAYGMFQDIYGGLDDDRLFVRMSNAGAYGGLGNDVLRSFAAFVDLHGDAGHDRISSGYRNGLDAGDGFDRCQLDVAVPGTGCERVTLLCYGGEPLPPEPPDNLTNAYGDFDGNGVEDILYVWKDGTQWVAHIETDGGFGGEAVLSTSQYDEARAIGGHDINGDGVEEAFLQVATGASTTVLGIFTLWEAVGSPATGLYCGLVPVMYAEAPAETSFIIGGPVLFQNGLRCRANHTLREYSQDTSDGYTYTQHRYDYDYLPGFGITDPVVHQTASSVGTLYSPADDAQIALGASFTCGGLSLYP